MYVCKSDRKISCAVGLTLFDPTIYEEYFNCNGEAQDDNNNFYDSRDADDDLSDVPEHIPRGKTEQLFFASVGDD